MTRKFSECLVRLAIIRINFNNEFLKAYWKFTLKIVSDLMQTFLTERITKRKKNWKHSETWFLPGHNCKQDLEILIFLKSVKFTNSLLKSSKFINIKNPCIQSVISCFDKLKNEILKFIFRFYFYRNMGNEIKIIDYYSRIKIDFYFNLLVLSFVFHFIKKWKTKCSSFFVVHFHEGIEKGIT